MISGKPAFIALVLMAIASQVQAQSVSYMNTVPMGSVDSSYATSISFPQFDSTLGVLNGINFTLAGTIQGSVTVQTTSANSAELQFRVQDNFTLSRPDSTILLVATAYTPTTYASLKAHDSITFANLVGTASNSATSLPPSNDLYLFTGSGNIALPISQAGYIATSSTGGNTIATSNMQASASMTITYNYTAAITPEPGSVALLIGLTTTGAGFLARRRKQARHAA